MPLMNKAFTKEDDGNEPPPFRSRFQPLPPGFRNLITEGGAAVLRGELADLKAAQGPKPEINDLAQRLDTHEVVPAPGRLGRVAFGSTAVVREESGDERRYTLVGIDESEPERGRIGWTSPLGRALLNQAPGNLVSLQTPKGTTQLELVAIE